VSEAEEASAREAAAEIVVWRLENDETFRSTQVRKVKRVNQHQLQVWVDGWPDDWPPVTWMRRPRAISLQRSSHSDAKPETWPLPRSVRHKLEQQGDPSREAIVTFVTYQMGWMGLLVGNGATAAEAARQICSQWRGAPRFERFLAREYRRIRCC
jgi:hypothetical protein